MPTCGAEVPQIACHRQNLAERISRAAGMRVRVCIVVGSGPNAQRREGGGDEEGCLKKREREERERETWAECS